MLTFALTLSQYILAAALVLNAWCLVRGPDATDRILALDTLYINAVALLVIYGVKSGFPHEAALVIALLGFVGTVSLAKFLLRGDIIE